MSAILEFKRKIHPALSREEFLDMFFNKKKRESTYKKFDEKHLEPAEDDFVETMKKRIELDDE